MATALPTIVAKLGGGKDYSWVGRWVIFKHRHTFRTVPRVSAYEKNSAYLLAAASLGPVYGKLSDLIGRERQIVFAETEDSLILSRRTETDSLYIYYNLPCEPDPPSKFHTSR